MFNDKTHSIRTVSIKTIAICLLIGLAFVTFLAKLSWAALPEAPIAQTGNNETNPDVYNRKVVYQLLTTQMSEGQPYDVGDIYYYDKAVGSTLAVATQAADQRYPAIWGKRIVWQDGRNDPTNVMAPNTNRDIYMYTIGVGEQALVTAAGNQDSPDIYGDKVVWLDYRSGAPEIYLKDLVSGVETNITANGNSKGAPAIYRDIIVWAEKRGTSYEQIYLYDLSVDSDGDGIKNYAESPRPDPDLAESKLTADSGFYQFDPAIYRNKVVWVDSRRGYIKDIRAFDLATSTESTLTTEITTWKRTPSIWGQRVAWQEDTVDASANILDSDIVLYDLNTSVKETVSNDGPSWDYFSRTANLFGNIIAWQDDRNNAPQFDIYKAFKGTDWDEIQAPAAPTNVQASNPGINGTLDISWTPPADLDVSGFKLHWGASPGNTTNTIEVWDTTSHRLSGLQNFQAYYVSVSAYDTSDNSSVKSAEATGTPTPDVTPPVDPTISGSSPAKETWTKDNTIEINWPVVGAPGGASDPGGSGVDGYSVDWTRNPTGVPDTVKDLEETAVSATSFPLPVSANDWYFHLRTVDNAGNWTNTVHYGPFWVDVDAPSAPTAANELGGAPNGTWQKDFPNPNFTWSGASDTGGSGLKGYYYYWGTSSSGDPVNWTTGGGYNPPAVSGSGTYYLRVKTEDNAGNRSAPATLFTFKYDAEPPSAPTAANELGGAPNGTWQKDFPNPNFTWSGASDTGGSGLKGYYYYWDTSSSGDPVNWTTGGGYNPPAMTTDTVTYYLRVKTEDHAGNQSAPETLFTFKYDARRPTDPVVTTSTPAKEVETSENTVYIAWDGATDVGGSGVDGFSIKWSREPGEVPDETKELEKDATSMISDPLVPDGNWYFHLRTKDNAGNWTSTIHEGPFIIESGAPTTGADITPPAPNETGWYTTAVSVRLTRDETTGTTHYRWDSGDWEFFSGVFMDLLVPEGQHTLDYYSVDGAENTETPVKQVTFKVDTQKPNDPSVSSPSHTVGAWSNDNTVDINFSGATDNGAGVDGFSYDWHQSPTHVPDAVKDDEENAVSTTSGPLADGNWYFHLRTRDNAGNWTSTRHVGPFKIDTVAPTASRPISPSYSTQISKTPTFKVGWTGSDRSPSSGIASYYIQYKVNAGGSWKVWQNWTGASEANFKGNQGRTYYFRAKAKDAAGNISGFSRIRRTIVPYDQDKVMIGRQGFAGTLAKAASSFYKGTVRFSRSRGHEIVFRFRGKGVALISTRGPKRSKAKIFVDGKYIKTIDTYARTNKFRVPVFVRSLGAGVHELKIVNLGTPGRRRLDVDGLAVRR